jgi:hypothetical protein
MDALWTAQVHLLTPPNEFGDTRCWANVVAWGVTPANFAENVCTILGRRSWTVLSIVQTRRAASLTIMADEVAEQIEAAEKQPGSCIFGSLHYYPSKGA